MSQMVRILMSWPLRARALLALLAARATPLFILIVSLVSGAAFGTSVGSKTLTLAQAVLVRAP